MHTIDKLRATLKRWFGQGRFRNARLRRILLGTIFFALLSLILFGQISPQQVDLQEGDLPIADVGAPRTMVDQELTERKRQLARETIPMQTQVDSSVSSFAREFIENLFIQIPAVRNLPNQDDKTKVANLAMNIGLPVPLPTSTLEALLKAEDSTLAIARQDALSMINEVLSASVRKEDVEDLKSRVHQEALQYVMKSQEDWVKGFVKELVKGLIRSNLIQDPVATEFLRTQAANEVPDVVIIEGELIVEKGKRVTAEQYALLHQFGLVGGKADFRVMAGTTLLSIVLVGMVGLYLYRYRSDLLERDSKLLLIGLVGILTLLLALLMKSFEDKLGPIVAYLMPVAVNSMLMTILLDAKVALVQSTIIALLVGLTTSVDQIQHALVAMVGSTVGVYAVAQVETRTDIYRAGALVALANVLTIFSIYLMQGQLTMEMWKAVSLGALNGLMVAILVTGALPLFENLFGVVTPLKLIELSNPNHPLLKKLLVEAPGSYHHTILVANLCEAAAETISADQVLARVGAYYHDIGKTKRPYFFVENQFAGENPHDKLPPSLSALIITSHVKDGLEMAREAGLPREIIDFIPEHHGTSLVSYFYHLASKNGQAEFVLEEDFRYDGPKPRTKETAICMLADGCEASVRAMRQKGGLSLEQIELQVKRIIQDRLQQGQLQECDLTFRELDRIEKSFVKVLGGVHHARIEYPPEVVQGRLSAEAGPTAGLIGGGESDGDLDRQRTGAGGRDGGTGGTGAPGDRHRNPAGSEGTGE